MKVRIEFSDPPADGPSQDMESNYSVVEFVTPNAGDVEGWADAVTSFIQPSIWRPKAIILQALWDLECTWDELLGSLNAEEVEDLRQAIERKRPPSAP